MSITYLRRKSSFGMLAIVVAGSVFLASCGGGGGGGGSSQSAGVGGTGIAAGKTTGFGSIYVNGTRYDTDSSQFIVDGDPGTQNDLAVGMYVKLRVKTLDGNFTGEALEVVYDEEIQGPVSLITPTGSGVTQRTFLVLGQTVTINDTGTIFKGTPGNPNFGFAGIEDGDVVEVSGFRTSPTAINATYVEFEEDLVLTSSEVELRGAIQNLNGIPPDETFEIDGIEIETDNFTQLNGLVLVETLEVEVKGIIQTQGPTTVLATKVEIEDDEFDDDVDDIKLQGVVSDIASGISNFLIGSQRVDASGIAGLALVDGMNIEVEGEIIGSKLIADEIEFEEEETKLRSYVDTVDAPNGKFAVHYPAMSGPTTVTVHVDSQTHFEDETGGVLVTSPFSLDDLNEGLVDYVRVEGVEIANNEVLANVIKRTSPDDKLELEAVVDGYDAGVSITVLGIQYQLDGSTTYEPPVPDIEVGDFVEIEDDDDPPPNQADGIADEVEEE